MNVYINSDNTLKKQVIKSILCLLPLYLYGFYKNGILLYNKELISFISIFKIFLFLLIGLFVYFITSKILKKELNFDLTFLSVFIIPLFLPYNTNIFIYFIVMFFIYLFRKYFNITLPILIFSLLFKFDTASDILGIYDYNVIDLLFGRNIGGIGSTSIIIGLIVAVVLTFTTSYKYIISLSGIITFLILGIIFNSSYLLLGNPINTLLLISIWSNLSPVDKLSQVIYGVIISLLGFILMNINIYYGMILSCFIVSFLYQILKVIGKRFNVRYNYEKESRK